MQVLMKEDRLALLKILRGNLFCSQILLFQNAFDDRLLFSQRPNTFGFKMGL